MALIWDMTKSHFGTALRSAEFIGLNPIWKHLSSHNWYFLFNYSTFLKLNFEADPSLMLGGPH